ncbi:MAG TPA: hypothetical protein VIK33_07140 [Anaerolineae bacterium]
MDTSHDHLSQQTVVKEPAPTIQRTITVRLDLRLLAACGAGLIVLGAFLPWLDPAAQAILGESRLAAVIQGWPSLLIGLITLGVLALPQTESSRWVSLPAAALGLAAAFISVASAITASSTVAETIARFPNTNAPVAITGPGTIVTIAGGLVCLIAGLAHPPTSTSEARLDLRPGQPAFTVLTSAAIVLVLVAGLIGAWIGSSGSGEQDENAATVPGDLLTTPVVNVQVTLLGPTPALTPNSVIGSEPSIPAPSPTEPGLPPTTPLPPAATATPTLSPTPSASPGDTATPTATATFSQSPLNR